MRTAAAFDQGGFQDAGAFRPLTEAGLPAGPAVQTRDLLTAIGEAEKSGGPRWVWPATADIAPGLLRHGVSVERCHDLTLTEGLLLGYEGRWGEPRSLGAAWARLHGLPVPEDHGEGTLTAPTDGPGAQPALFEPDRTGLPPDVEPLDAALAVHADQQRRIAATADPARFRLLVAAESASALASAEMSHAGLPWRADVHGELLTQILGPRPLDGLPPPELVAASARLAAALGVRALNADSPSQVTKAFADLGIRLTSTRAWELKEIDHPAAPLLIKYKELSRLHAANGWSWVDTWVHAGRFRPEYTVGGVVSGRWAARGGGALQLPRHLRRAVIADPGWVFVVADAAQLEPRVLAALSGDKGMAEATKSDDMYSALAGLFDNSRAQAKVGLLAAMYGQTSGVAAAPLALMRRRFPAATAYVEDAAREGERGRVVRSHLGRTCPPPSEGWQAAIAGDGDVESDPDTDLNRRSGQAARARGRFTRNFVIQATAAEWAEVLLALLRQRLRSLAADQSSVAELVFFQHDEVVVHCPRDEAADIEAAVRGAASDAGRLVFVDTPVRFPMSINTVECYGDAK